MANTPRTSTALLALLADNVVGAIGEQDLRDVIESMKIGFGGLYVSSSSATTISIAGTYYKAAGTTGLIDSNDFTMPSDNRLTYGGDITHDFLLLGTVSMSCAANNKIIGWKFAKNGVVIDSSTVRRNSEASGDVGALMILGFVSLATDDYVELFCTNEDSTDAVTAEQLVLAAIRLWH